MKTSKIVIKNLFGIRETTLDGKSVEISGPKGAGKTSVLDAIRFALTNRSERDCIVHQGADEGEIIIETTTGLSIDRKALPAKSAGTVKVRDGSLLQTRPAEFLSQIFTPLQLNPVEFTQLSRQEKNRVILSLIEFDWDVNWIREQFGEIPQGVDYSKHSPPSSAALLVGGYMANVPKRKETDIEGDLFELPEKIAAASDSPESWVKNIHLVDLWAQEQKYQTHDVNWFKMPDGSLVCSLSNRQRITIPCPDALGMVNLSNGARCGMQEALDLAYLTLIRDHPNDRMLWDLQAVRKWGKSPATAKQLEIIKKRCKGFDTANLSKGDASQILNRLLNEPKKRRGA